MSPELQAIAMLNNMFESHDGRPVENAVLTRKDYGFLVEVLAARPEVVEAHIDHPLRHFDRTCPACLAQAADKARAALAARPEARPSEKEQAAADILLALVALKFYKDTQGKNAYYEAKQPGLWALAKEFLERAMPKEYALVVDGIGKRLDMNSRPLTPEKP